MKRRSDHVQGDTRGKDRVDDGRRQGASPGTLGVAAASGGRPAAHADVGQAAAYRRGLRKGIGLALLAVATGALLVAAVIVGAGLYDISANVQHTQPVYTLLERTMHQSVRRRAAGVGVPALDDEAAQVRGAACYRAHCVQCHGGPGAAPAAIGRSMQPLPGPLVDAARRWAPQEVYWITRNGIKMSGMPAWEYRMADRDLWAVVAFVSRRLPNLSAADFARAGSADDGCAPSEGVSPVAPVAAAPSVDAGRTTTVGAPDAERGRNALTQFACNACHVIPGVTGSDVQVGPPLAGIARQSLIAGAIPNTPDQMVRWIRDPAAVDPGTAMPNLQVGERDARDMAAYLATLR